MNCPKCQSPIPSENINISADIAQCEECKNVFKISTAISAKAKTEQIEVDPNFDMGAPPKGAWIEKSTGELVLGATTRSPIAFFMVPFMMVWSGFSIGGIYGTQIMSGEFDLASSLFGIPFILGSILFWSLALMFVIGKVEVTLDHNDGKIFTGIGSLGWTKRFSLEEITSVREDTKYGQKGSAQHTILLEGQNRVAFGTMLNESRRYYILKALQQIFADKAKGKSFLQPNLSRHLIHRN